MSNLGQHPQQWLQSNAFMVHNHIQMDKMETDHAVFRLNICPESWNPMGMVHGGAMYTLADNAAGAAAYSDGRVYVTQSGTLHFLRNQSEGVLLAEARVRHRGKMTCVVTVDITGDEGTLIATGDFSFFCIGKQE